MSYDTSAGNDSQAVFSPLHALEAVFAEDARPRGHARLVYLALASLADGAGLCSPSIKDLAARCAVSRRTVIRALKELAAGGWIGVRLRPGRRSQYIVLERRDQVGRVSERQGSEG